MEWLENKDRFEILDVRRMKGNFLPAILKKTQVLQERSGLCIVQSFEPIPLYSALEDLGYEHHTEKVSENEYRAYFFRKETRSPAYPDGMDIPLKPTAIVNFSGIDPTLADVVVNFWNIIWGNDAPALDMKMRLLLSLANGVGAGRTRQATREFIKAYSLGVSVREFDELFSLLVWNQGIGHFASEIGPSSLFAAYQYVKKKECEGVARPEIVKGLTERFGEGNPDVCTFYRTSK